MLSSDLTDQWISGVSMRYAVGPKLEIGLPLGFGIEVDALYRHESYRIAFSPEYAEQHASSWEFPFLVRKSLAFPGVKPFVEAGYAPRVLRSPYDSGTGSQGFVIGGGVQFGVGRLLLAPVVRYTHWNNNPVLLVIPNGPSPQVGGSQADALVGVSWKIR